MSVDGLRYRSRDEGTIQGGLLTIDAGNPLPAQPLSQATGLLAVTIAIATEVTLWSAGASPLGRFDYCYVMAGAYPTVDGLDDSGTTPALAGQLELTCNDGDAAEQIWIEQLVAGLPYRRFSDISRFNISSGGDGFSGTASVVNKLRYKNDTSAPVTVRYCLAAV